MSRSGVAAAGAGIACLVAIPSATAEWTPPLLPTIARHAGSAKVSVHCLTVREWSAGRLPKGSIVVRRGSALFVTDHACSVLVGYATSFPHTPRAGSPAEFAVASSLYRLLVVAVSRLHLGRGRADCRVLELFSPALKTLGEPSTTAAKKFLMRLLVARKRLHLDVRPSSRCPVQLPKAKPS